MMSTNESVIRGWPEGQRPSPADLLNREWLVTNGLGGYACGTLAGVATRRYHGFLIAAQPAPLGRVMMVNHLWESLRLPDYRTVVFGGEETMEGDLRGAGLEHLEDFRLEAGLPVWRYEVEGFRLEKRVCFAHQQNTVYLRYLLESDAGRVRLKLKPAVCFRGHDDSVSVPGPEGYTLTVSGEQYELNGPATYPSLRLMVHGARAAAFTTRAEHLPDLMYRVEAERGYDHRGSLYAPGHFRMDLEPGRPVTLVLSTEPWETIKALDPETVWQAEQRRRDHLIAQAAVSVRTGIAAELVLAADQFIISPVTRAADETLARARGDAARSVIAGYHWFTDWGRDTMISLEGLTLTTGRFTEAGHILRTFAHHIRDGLIPNMFPEGGREGLYHTADATLWFFHALRRYLDHTGDLEMLRDLLPKLRDIVAHHLRGTRFGIRVDEADGLLTQGAEGYQLTWMDAKVGDWVVTPRRGKAVEINALWYNALRLLEEWTRDEQGLEAAAPFARHAERVAESFNRRFQHPSGGRLYDVVDGPAGNDDALRPNQVFAISLNHPVLDRDWWAPVCHTVADQLLTPVGLRSLAPGHPDYKPRYFGDLRARDAAYHQGTVWGWLIGPFVDAWVRTFPGDHGRLTSLLQGFRHHLGEACIGSISEVFDAEAPYTPRGCVAQAWSIAEVLRCWAKVPGGG